MLYITVAHGLAHGLYGLLQRCDYLPQVLRTALRELLLALFQHLVGGGLHFQCHSGQGFLETLVLSLHGFAVVLFGHALSLTEACLLGGERLTVVLFDHALSLTETLVLSLHGFAVVFFGHTLGLAETCFLGSECLTVALFGECLRLLKMLPVGLHLCLQYLYARTSCLTLLCILCLLAEVSNKHGGDADCQTCNERYDDCQFHILYIRYIDYLYNCMNVLCPFA